ncbi:SGNH/GDSL hydrolase family protein [Actinoplanes sp. NPDC049596]|uniref:SGNH/GDSL hydrolase family protein n=1 Tax=unclassified Actinoplanes TaxID=2626549 RepID=UPI0034194D79
MTGTRKTTLAVLVALAVLAVAACSKTPAPAPETTNRPSPVASDTPAQWVGSWAVAVQSGGRSFEKQTVRQIVHTSIGGSTVRIRLSNEFGTGPLTVANIHVAVSKGDAAIDAGTSTAVTFNRAASVRIEAGKTAESDAVDFELPAGADVAVSAYLPDGSQATTQHAFANRHNYVGWNDQTTNATIQDAETADSYYFLSGVDVQNPAAEGAVVTLGASITDGFDSAFGANKRWPDLLARRLSASGRTVGVLNTGISGNKLLKDGTGDSVRKRFERDALAQPSVKWVIVSDAAINDLGSDRPSGDELTAALRDLVTRAHAAGIKIFLSTLTPFEGAGYWSAEGETGRAAVNAFIRGGSSGADGVIDLDAATHDPGDQTRYRSGYDSGDHLHPDDAGMQAIADTVDLSLFR